MQSAQRFEISDEEISAVVAEFYDRVRKNEIIGPIFTRAIGVSKDAWREHEEKITSFWRNAIGIDRAYSGNPMRVHMENSEVKPEHFLIWLNLFHEVINDLLDPITAANFGDLADRIGEGLSFGIENYRNRDGSPPILKRSI